MMAWQTRYQASKYGSTSSTLMTNILPLTLAIGVLSGIADHGQGAASPDQEISMGVSLCFKIKKAYQGKFFN